MSCATAMKATPIVQLWSVPLAGAACTHVVRKPTQRMHATTSSPRRVRRRPDPEVPDTDADPALSHPTECA